MADVSSIISQLVVLKGKILAQEEKVLDPALEALEKGLHSKLTPELEKRDAMILSKFPTLWRTAVREGLKGAGIELTDDDETVVSNIVALKVSRVTVELHIAACDTLLPTSDPEHPPVAGAVTVLWVNSRPPASSGVPLADDEGDVPPNAMLAFFDNINDDSDASGSDDGTESEAPDAKVATKRDRTGDAPQGATAPKAAKGPDGKAAAAIAAAAAGAVESGSDDEDSMDEEDDMMSAGSVWEQTFEAVETTLRDVYFNPLPYVEAAGGLEGAAKPAKAKPAKVGDAPKAPAGKPGKDAKGAPAKADAKPAKGGKKGGK